MKNVIKKRKYIVVFIISILILDILLSFVFQKDFYDFYNLKKINIIEKSLMTIVTDDEKKKNLGIKNINWFPFWDAKYRGPTFNYEYNSDEKCRVVGIWGSIIRWSWVKYMYSYFHRLWINFINSEFINLGIPWSMPLQQIIKLDKENVLDDTDLLIWSIWHDDFFHFTYSNWILYNSKITLNNYWAISLFNFLSEDLNNFFINNSLVYNKLLKIKVSWEIAKTSVDITEDYIMESIKNKVDDFIKTDNKKVIFLMSPYLWTKHKQLEDMQHIYMYNKFKDYFSDNENISVIDLAKLLDVDDFSPYNLDDVHFNEIGSENVAEKLYEFIIANKQLDEKCY